VKVLNEISSRISTFVGPRYTYWIESKLLIDTPVPVISTFYCCLWHYKDTGYTTGGWASSPGRPPIIDVDKIIDLTTKDSVGMITSITDTRHILEAEARKTAEAKSGCLLSAQTVRNYKSLASVNSTSQILKFVHQKLDNRHTAEKLIISTVFFSMYVSSTHYIFIFPRNYILNWRQHYFCFQRKIWEARCLASSTK